MAAHLFDFVSGDAICFTLVECTRQLASVRCVHCQPMDCRVATSKNEIRSVNVKTSPVWYCEAVQFDRRPISGARCSCWITVVSRLRRIVMIIEGFYCQCCFCIGGYRFSVLNIRENRPDQGSPASSDPNRGAQHTHDLAQ